MRFDVITIFPDYFAPLQLSLIGRAIADGLLELRVHDLRDWTHDRHRTVDDTPCGGGAGMVMKPEPWGEAFDELLGTEPDPEIHVVVPTPSGYPFRQRDAEQLSTARRILFCCQTCIIAVDQLVSLCCNSFLITLHMEQRFIIGSVRHRCDQTARPVKVLCRNPPGRVV